METINDYILKLTGKVSILEPLELGHNYKLLIDGEVTSVTDTNNQDGTKNRVYKYEPILCTIQKDNGETIKAKDARSNSTKIRKVLYAVWLQKNSDLDFDNFYDRFTALIISNVDALTDKI